MARGRESLSNRSVVMMIDRKDSVKCILWLIVEKEERAVASGVFGDVVCVSNKGGTLSHFFLSYTTYMENTMMVIV